MSEVVLDASALLALLNREPGHEKVARTIPHATIGAVNLSEVVAKLVDSRMPEGRLGKPSKVSHWKSTASSGS